MSDTNEIIIQPSPYGLVIKDKRFGIVLIFVVTFLLCVALYPRWGSDYEQHEPLSEPTAQVSPISNSADIVVTATPDYIAPSE